MNNKFIVTGEDMKRYEILTSVKRKEIRLKEASIILNVSYRHVLRLYSKFKTNGLDGLIKKYNNSFKRKKVFEVLENKIITLHKDIYYDFNIMHFKEKLEQNHEIKLSYETIRQICIKNKLHIPKKRKKVPRRRRRMPKAGLLVQMDSSQHEWIDSIDEKWWLISTIDDATNEVAASEFVKSDNTYTNMSVIRQLLEKKGTFHALYTDKASHFKTTRAKGIHQNIKDELEDTQIQRALKELDIELITASTCQAKGRIERLFRFFQDRLIKEMRINNIADYEQANIFLKTIFLPWYNKRYTHKAPCMYKPLLNGINLDIIFALKFSRKVRKDNTIKINNEYIQLYPKDNFYAKYGVYVELRIKSDNTVYVMYGDEILLVTKLKNPIRNIEKLKRERFLDKRSVI